MTLIVMIIYGILSKLRVVSDFNCYDNLPYFV